MSIPSGLLISQSLRLMPLYVLASLRSVSNFFIYSFVVCYLCSTVASFKFWVYYIKVFRISESTFTLAPFLKKVRNHCLWTSNIEGNFEWQWFCTFFEDGTKSKIPTFKGGLFSECFIDVFLKYLWNFVFDLKT